MKLRGCWLGVGLSALIGVGCGGCGTRSFEAQGNVTSSGGRLGAWRSTPQGCARGGVVGSGLERRASEVSLLWEDPSRHDRTYHDHALERAPDLPQRLDVVRGPGGLLTGVIATVKTKGTQLDTRACREFSLETREGERVVAEGRPTLAGRLRMDCDAGESRVTADVRFQRCEW